MKLFVVGLNFRTAPVTIRESLARCPAISGKMGPCLQGAQGLSELVMLSTCNRVELYGVTRRHQLDPRALFQLMTHGHVEVDEHLYVHEGAEAIDHLFKVSSGLDSMVLGETEITGQVKDAYAAAQAGGMTGPVLNRLFQKALQTAKEIRSSTDIGRHPTSVGSVAAELADRIFGAELAQRTVMILGAGSMGATCVRYFLKKGIGSVIVVNRSLDHAEELAREFGGRALPLTELTTALAEADIVVGAATAPQALVTAADVSAMARARRFRPIFFIDVAVPRNIDAAVANVESATLYNLDDLEAVAAENSRLRHQALDRCQAIVDQKKSALMARLFPADGEQPDDTRVRPEHGRVHGGCPVLGR